MDIGGIGFGPDGTDVFMEGLYIPFLKVLDAGKVNETLMAMIRANTRLPIDTVGDVYSLMACNDVGCQRLVEMMDEFHLDNLDELAEHICAKSRAAVLAEIALLPKGSWSNAMTTDGFDGPITLRATTTISDTGIHVDYTGTDPQARRGINVPFAYTTAYTVFGLGCIVASRIPNNAGSLGPLTVSAPEGCILNARKPAAVCIRHVIGQMLPDVVFGCLAQAIPDRVPAEGTSCLWNIIVRGSVKGGGGGNYGFTMAITSNGGTGARPHADGLSATAYPVRRQGHAGGDRRGHHAADLLAQGAAARLRRRRAHARRAGPGHRDRERHRRAVRAAGGLRPHRSTRRAAATAAGPAPPAWSPSRTAPRCAARARRWCAPASAWSS